MPCKSSCRNSDFRLRSITEMFWFFLFFLEITRSWTKLLNNVVWAVFSFPILERSMTLSLDTVSKYLYWEKFLDEFNDHPLIPWWVMATCAQNQATVISDICTRHFAYSSSLAAELWLLLTALGTSVSCLFLFAWIAGMVEAQLKELATAVQSVQAQLMAGEAALSNLQAQVERLGRSSGERKIGVDTRNLGRPSQFSGTDRAWRDWSVVFRSYAALVHPALKDEMQRVERMSTPETNAGLIETEQVQASTDLYHLLPHRTSGPALDRVVNAGSAEGLRAWQLFVVMYDPHIRSRTAGQLLSLLQFDFSGDTLASSKHTSVIWRCTNKLQGRRSQMACVLGLFWTEWQTQSLQLTCRWIPRDFRLSMHFTADYPTNKTFSDNCFCQSAQSLRSSCSYMWGIWSSSTSIGWALCFDGTINCSQWN